MLTRAEGDSFGWVSGERGLSPGKASAYHVGRLGDRTHYSTILKPQMPTCHMATVTVPTSQGAVKNNGDSLLQGLPLD